ncbi:hypothetical protein M2164_005274 [Streptomyces sp. SAI-208]|jgi:hypothetical protein|uniref:hypothetical protein n=1 Tax=unclassified Streptomyces TaxID=2593676 RepID=UPI002475A5A2|nr:MULTISPECIES: hypothetical protein [unclassified Streptomyces]MDH6518792.1 hypothetical protein [Streptomyces sp. SAI-090]MDH6551011.1 hypothetical protein [Streptomyces sp. SAI-041]MDH6570075.1 hypothetical protein [Streptomyces sp. SAI-117]MDH6584951.1 hypothetical protein [Streptomyces sp. SAI-133]MDH6609639.1 hypothetical protein [Streptomyces sp. SAI-208]
MSALIRRLRGLATLAGFVALAVYAWGLLHLAGAVLEAEDGGTNSAPLPPCRGNDQAVHVMDYSVSYLPLSFDCEMNGGGSYSAGAIPGYVNPVALGSALAAAGCAIASAWAAELRLRAEAREGGAR